MDITLLENLYEILQVLLYFLINVYWCPLVEVSEERYMIWSGLQS